MEHRIDDELNRRYGVGALAQVQDRILGLIAVYALLFRPHMRSEMHRLLAMLAALRLKLLPKFLGNVRS